MTAPTISATPKKALDQRATSRHDTTGNVVKVMRIATGEEADPLPPDDGYDPAAKARGQRRSQTCRFYVS
jgi:hypothetical protein